MDQFRIVYLFGEDSSCPYLFYGCWLDVDSEGNQEYVIQALDGSLSGYYSPIYEIETRHI